MSQRIMRHAPLGARGGLLLAALLCLGVGQQLPLAAGGSCREAQLCCNGRDSSCVVQKAPVNAIIEDLSDKPCYCDHACLKLGDCCDDFKDHCGVLDCQVGDWGAWSECDKSCGAGMMTRTRQILQPVQNGGKHCPSLLQKRACQGYRCHGHRDKKILREMALLLPAALSRNHHANNSSDLHRNLRTRYRDSYKHNRDHEYCVEFEVIKASKACHKLPPYNLMLEGDRITVRCDLEALVQDAATATAAGKQGSRGAAATTTTTTRKTPMAQPYSMDDGDDADRLDSSSSNNEDDNEDDEEETSEEDDAQNMLEPEAEPEPEPETEVGSNESHEYKHQRQLHHARSATSKRSAAPILPPALQLKQREEEEQQQLLLLSYHCRGEGLSGRTTRWSALPAPSCRGKWLRLTIGPPKKCNHAQFIFV